MINQSIAVAAVMSAGCVFAQLSDEDALKKDGYKKVLVIGKAADERQCQKGGSAAGNVPYEVTFFAALKARLPEAEVKLMPFCAKIEQSEIDTGNAAEAGVKVERCEKELKGFAKTKLLAPGESETVKIFVSKRDLAYWDDFASRFTTDAGAYELLVGASSVDIRSRQQITVAETVRYRD